MIDMISIKLISYRLSIIIMPLFHRIVLQNLDKPDCHNISNNIFWFCDTLGFSAGRDTENLCNEIFLSILQETAKESIITSDTLAELHDISVGRVNHHIRNLNRTGLVYRDKKTIRIRRQSLLESVQEIRKDADRIFDELEEMAGKIDEKLGISIHEDNKNKNALIIPENKPRL